jgi:hypothetical protein
VPAGGVTAGLNEIRSVRLGNSGFRIRRAGGAYLQLDFFAALTATACTTPLIGTAMEPHLRVTQREKDSLASPQTSDMPWSPPTERKAAVDRLARSGGGRPRVVCAS